MTDVREAILVRLGEILTTIPNIKTTARNTAVNLADLKLPAAILFDGDERAVDDVREPSGRPRIMALTPEIVLAQQSDEPGSDLSTLRAELVKRVTLDPTLNSIIAAPVGRVRYEGCTTDFGQGRKLQGVLTANFTIRYVLFPEQL